MPDPVYDPATEVLARGRDGSLRAVPLAEVDQVAASGGQVLDEQQAAEAVQDVYRRREAESTGGQVRTAAGGVVSGILDPFAALGGGTGRQAAAGLLGVGEAPEYTQRAYEQLQFDREVNPMLSYAAETLGTGATAYLGGAGVGAIGSRVATRLGVGALAEQAAGKGIAAWGARAAQAAPEILATASENAIAGIGAANEAADEQGRTLTADDVVSAGTVGAALGLGIGAGARGAEFLGRKVVQKVASAIPEGALNSFAERQAFLSAAREGGATKAIKQLSKDADGGVAASNRIGRRLLDEGITEIESKQGTQAALDAVIAKRKEAGAALDAVYKQAEGHIDPSWLYEKLQGQAEEIAASAGPKAANRFRKAIDNDLDFIVDKMKRGEAVGAADVQGVRSAIKKELRDRATSDVRRETLQRFDQALTGTLEEAVTRADAAAGEGSTMLSNWKDANTAYRELSTVRDSYAATLGKRNTSKLLNYSDQAHGERLALLGGLATGNIGAGALLGLGATAAKRMFREKGAGWMARAADALAQRGEMPSVTRLLQSSAAAREQLSHFAVSQMVQKGARKLAEGEAPAGFGYGALANYSDPKSVADQYAAASGYLDKTDGDIEGIAGRVNQHLGGFATESPELTAQAQMQTARALDYLRENRPPTAPPSILAASFGNASKRLPQPYEQVSWLKRFRATVDPSVIYGEIARGYVNPETVETLQTLYPSYYASVVEGTIGALNSNPAMVQQMSYSQRLALDNLTGGRGLIEPTRRFSVQDRLAQANAEVSQAASAPSPSARKPPNVAQFEYTQGSNLMSPRPA